MMPAISTDEFVVTLRGLTRDELVSFVADLLAARGWSTRIDGSLVVATRAGVTHRFLVRHDARLRSRLSWGVLRDDPDRIITSGTYPGGSSEIPVIDAGDLRDIALYGIDRSDCKSLFSRYLDCKPIVGESELRERTYPFTVPPFVPFDAEAGPIAFVILIGAVVIIGGLLATTPGVLGGMGIGPDSGFTMPGGVTGVEADDVSTSGDRTAVDQERDTTTGGVDNSSTLYPPGLADSGLGSSRTLAQSHGVALLNQSHRWTMTYAEYRDEQLIGFRTERMAVADRTTYRSDVAMAGTLITDPEVVANRSTYVNDGVQFELVTSNETMSYRQRPVTAEVSGPLERPMRLIRRYLLFADTRLVNTTRRGTTSYYHIRARGDLLPQTRNVSATIVIDDRGVVREVHREHRLRDSNVTVVITFHVTGIGNTSVTSPDWVRT